MPYMFTPFVQRYKCFDLPCAIIQAKFLHSKQNEKLVESSGKGEPVLDFEQRMERRIEGKKGAKWSIAISLT